MKNHQSHEKPWGAAEHIVIGAGVGAAGVGNSIALIGLSTGLAVLPISLLIGAGGGLLWWAVKKIAKELR